MRTSAFRFLWGLWLCLAPRVVGAQSPDPLVEKAGGRLRYGIALHSGSQRDLGPGLSYSGMTPNDLGVSGWYFGSSFIGGAFGLQREGFKLLGDENAQVASGSLVRGHLGPSARFQMGPVRLEALLGYQLAQLPGFGSSASPRFSAITRHAVLVASRAMIDLGPVTAELRGELPLAVSVRDGSGANGSSSGFSLSAAAAMSFGRLERLSYGGVLDYQLVSDSFAVGTVAEGAQMVSRIGLALELKWLSAPSVRAPQTGRLRVTLVDLETQTPLAGAAVVLIDAAGAQHALTVNPLGQAAAQGLPVGRVQARATIEGYLPVEASAEVRADAEVALELAVRKPAPRTGALVVTVVDKETGATLVGVTVETKAGEYLTDASGKLALLDLAPGPTQIKVRLKGYKPGAEVALVVAGKSSTLSIPLLREARKALATITGLVRSTQGGTPVSAELELPQTKSRTRANAQGAFVFRVEGGTYTVNISATGYLSQSKNVTVKDGDQAIFNVDLHPK